MKNGSAASEDLSKGRKSSAISVAIARNDNDSRSALGDQHLYEPSNIGIGHGAIDAAAATIRSQEYSALQFRESVDPVSERRRHAFRLGRVAHRVLSFEWQYRGWQRPT